eukprot:2464318-Prymnesium_polylepis.2
MLLMIAGPLGQWCTAVPQWPLPLYCWNAEPFHAASTGTACAASTPSANQGRSSSHALGR